MGGKRRDRGVGDIEGKKKDEMSTWREGRSEKIGKRREIGAGGECWGRGERGKI